MTHNRDELKEKIRQALRSKGEEFTTDSTAGHFLWSHSYEAAEACLSAIEQSGCTIFRWQPIETASRDGSYFLALYGKKDGLPLAESIKPARWVVGFFDGQDGFLDCAEHEEFDQPTHWMPLPQAPSQIEEPRSGDTDPST